MRITFRLFLLFFSGGIRLFNRFRIWTVLEASSRVCLCGIHEAELRMSCVGWSCSDVLPFVESLGVSCSICPPAFPRAWTVCDY
jgi:hypothetical protein